MFTSSVEFSSVSQPRVGPTPVIRIDAIKQTTINPDNSLETTLLSRLAPGQGLNFGSYQFRGQLRNVIALSDPQGNLVYEDLVNPVPVTVDGIISGSDQYQPAFPPIRGTYNLLDVIGGEGFGSGPLYPNGVIFNIEPSQVKIP